MENGTIQKYPYEEFNDKSNFRPFPDAVLRTKSDIAKELEQPCSRFNSAASFDEALNHRIGAIAQNFDPLSPHSLVLRKGIPLNWHSLVNYLHTNHITASKSFYVTRMANDSPKMLRISLASSDIQANTDGRIVYPHGFGASTSLEEAMSKAVGELLERHILTLYREKDLISMSPDGARAGNRNALDIFDLNGFLPWQQEKYPGFKRSPDSVIRWVRGRELTGGKDAYIPAQLVFWNYKLMEGEPLLAETNTNGCAGHFTFREAVVASLLELIQRDGFMIYWLNMIAPPVIDPTSITDPEVLEMLRHLQRYRFDCYLLDITSDISVPTCACVLVDRAEGGEPSISLGAASGFNFRDMALQSIGEAISIHPAFKKREGVRLLDPHIPFTDARIARDERLYLWRGREMYEKFAFFLSGRRKTVEAFMGNAGQMRTVDQQYNYLLDLMRARGSGYEVYCYEAKHPVLDKLGYHVVQTVVPKLMRIYLRESLPTLDAVRLREVPAKIGYAAPDTYNPLPHPFP